jgi:nucleoside phosphorylase
VRKPDAHPADCVAARPGSAVGLAVANAQAAADFYAGKQIELIVGSGSGGGYASPDTLDYMKKLLTNAGGG